MYIYTHTYIHIYIYIYIFMCGALTLRCLVPQAGSRMTFPAKILPGLILWWLRKRAWTVTHIVQRHTDNNIRCTATEK